MIPEQKSNKFDHSHEHQLSFRHGKLVPILVKDILPGDKIKLSHEVFIRMAPMVAPLMHRLNVKTYYFFVPTRIIWDDYELFFTRGRDNDAVVTVPPIVVDNVTKTNFPANGLGDYMGIPPCALKTISGDHYLSALPFRAYQMIWNEHFRNQEVEDELDIDTSSAAVEDGDVFDLTVMRQKNWDLDYFTSCKKQPILNPDEQGFALLSSYEGRDAGTIYEDISVFFEDDGTLPGTAEVASHNSSLNLGATPGNLGRVENLYSDVGIQIEDLRRVSAMQRWLEMMIRVGYRYVDYLKGTWNVVSPDGRQMRPEYLGGHSQPVRISEVLNTSATATEPQGEQSGHGISSGGMKPIFKSFNEHGYLIGLMCVTPKASYFQGIDEHYFKLDHLDYANPYLANLGMQETPTRQLYYDWEESRVDNEHNFGYKHRYAEYKTTVDRVSGEFRDTLAYWHMAREFSAIPGLNHAFVQCFPKDDIFAVTSGDHYFAEVYFHLSMMRNLPYFSTPKID